MKKKYLHQAEPYLPPRAEALPFLIGQPILDGSSTLDDGEDDGGWGNDIY